MAALSGGWGEMFGVVPPYVPGNGVAGVVASLGDGVEQVQFDPADLPPLVEQALAEVSAGRIEAAQAHRSIESRDTLGKTLLLP
jgi:hypothetical protein